MRSLNQSVNYNTEVSICEVLKGRIRISLAFLNIHVGREHLAQAWPLETCLNYQPIP